MGCVGVHHDPVCLTVLKRVLAVPQVWNGDEGEQTGAGKERRSESVPDVIVEARYGEDEEEEEELSRKMEAATLQDKGAALLLINKRGTVPFPELWSSACSRPRPSLFPETAPPRSDSPEQRFRKSLLQQELYRPC